MIAEVSVAPLGAGVSMSRQVARAAEIADQSGLDYRLTAMGTILEGNWEQIMKVARQMHDRVLESSDRILMHISIDDRKDKEGHIDNKIKSVEDELGKKVKK